MGFDLGRRSLVEYVKKTLIPSTNTEDDELRYKVAIANHELQKSKYEMLIDMLKETGYLIDQNIQITEMDEFVQTYDVEVRHTESGTFVTNNNYDLMTLTVPGNKNEVRLISRGQENIHSYCHRLEIEHLPGAARVEILKYNRMSKLFRYISIVDDINRVVVVFPENGIEMTTDHVLRWQLRYFDEAIKFEDIDIKKESIKYSGIWDICVHKDTQEKFPWWKDGKYVGGV